MRQGSGDAEDFPLPDRAPETRTEGRQRVGHWAFFGSGQSLAVARSNQARDLYPTLTGWLAPLRMSKSKRGNWPSSGAQLCGAHPKPSLPPAGLVKAAARRAPSVR